jgi:hypothetical protein
MNEIYIEVEEHYGGEKLLLCVRDPYYTTLMPSEVSTLCVPEPYGEHLQWQRLVRTYSSLKFVRLVSHEELNQLNRDHYGEDLDLL